MSNRSTTTVEPYMPALLQPSETPGPVERFLTKPFVRQARLYLSDE
jgi:hypothetical protein